MVIAVFANCAGRLAGRFGTAANGYLLIDGAAACVVLASTHERALEVVPLDALRRHAVDVPPGPGDL